MPVILTAADNPTIRQTIRADVDDAVLPDDIIGQDSIAGAAVREVKLYDPIADTRIGDQQMRLKLAAIYFAAARLAQIVALPTSETFGTYKYTNEPFDGPDRASTLYWQGLGEVATALGLSVMQLAGIVTMGTPAGTRGDLTLSLRTAPLSIRSLGSGGSSFLGPF